MDFKLRFDSNEVEKLALRYVQNNKGQETEDIIINQISPVTKKTGYYTKEAFLTLCRWKSPRIQPLCSQNDEQFIEEVTAVALKPHAERLRIEVLTLLEGVEWPVASVLLHFGHVEPYPVLDFRALWSLTIPQPSSYEFAFWWDYVRICRSLAKQLGVSMRALDRALWQYSKENDKKSAQTAD